MYPHCILGRPETSPLLRCSQHVSCSVLAEENYTVFFSISFRCYTLLCGTQATTRANRSSSTRRPAPSSAVSRTISTASTTDVPFVRDAFESSIILTCIDTRTLVSHESLGSVTTVTRLLTLTMQRALLTLKKNSSFHFGSSV